ncbi:MAG: sigma 54-interacting transcriptional regulator [Bacteriovoracaceae bacterium]|nr:sigma 54-interacting transcriptional regulator [Bacteriovoracaceae bacterium]
MGNILLVDDEEMILFTLGELLKSEGHSISTASNMSDALEQIEKTTFDLSFVDIRLGDDDGIELLRALRQKDQNCPVILMTGTPTLETVTEGLRLGAFDYLTKPASPVDLFRTVNLALKQKYLEEEYTQARTNLEAIFKSVKDGIITVDFDYHLLETNEGGGQSICGIDRSLIGHDIRNINLPCSRKCLALLTKTLTTGVVHEDNYVCCGLEQSSEKIVSITSSPLINAHDNSIGAVLVIRDQSRLIALERDLQDRHSFHRLVGSSEQMQAIYRLIENLKDVSANVLITGESGTGKELVAEALHHLGNRSQGPLVKVNCAALPNSLLESELFGHTKGAFTGAVRDQIGRFERAQGGTIFLDEIGEISSSIQVKLLRVIQEKEIERIGGQKTISVDFRILVATNADLQEKIKQGQFREDLYFRLKVVEVSMPPLRQRRGDIPELVNHFLETLGKEYQRKINKVDDQVLDLLMNHPWPGNVRQLRHTLEHAVVLCHGPVIGLNHLPPDFTTKATPVTTLEQKVQASPEMEAQQIKEALIACGGNKAKAARRLNMDRSTLYRKIDRYGISISVD